MTMVYILLCIYRKTYIYTLKNMYYKCLQKYEQSKTVKSTMSINTIYKQRYHSTMEYHTKINCYII